MTYFQNPISINGICYFASDFHLGAPANKTKNEERELRIIQWLDNIQQDATHLFLLGDIFDFWFEYRDVVPRGYYRLFAKFAELRQRQITVYYFTGNHDMWVKDYFEKEFGFTIFRQQQAFIINGKHCLVGHGDGLGPKDYGYKFIKALFAFRPNIAFFGALSSALRLFDCPFLLPHRDRSMNLRTGRVFYGQRQRVSCSLCAFRLRKMKR
jgi:UDP-2,3-diacylglucosamine hydrolase